MAVLLRAIVMLLVLVGLPAAWVYYGPLPPGPQRMVDQVIEAAKASANWAKGSTVVASDQHDLSTPTAPVFNASSRTLFDPQVVPAAGSAPLVTETNRAAIGETITTQIEPELSLLRSMGAEEYVLERWGADQQLFRFRCAISLGGNDELTRQFEAVAADPIATVREVVGEVTSWQNARATQLDGPQWR